ncbi:uncharacterized protein [Centruroides vittatus]|uniref:uncharacterized protein isoform X2 n=1 Tax=Centruroides vittatus TaxID=120091 RepID=UPI00350F62BD
MRKRLSIVGNAATLHIENLPASKHQRNNFLISCYPQIIMNDMKSPQSENGSFSDGTFNQQNSENSDKAESKSPKSVGSKEIGFFSMSPLQKFFFIFSLLLSVLYIIVFAWLIPCQNIQSDSLNNSSIEVVEEWKLNLEGLSMTSNLEVLRNSKLNEDIAIFGYSTTTDQTKKFGLIALSATDGKMFWQRSTSFVPKYCKCDSLDVNLDSVMDCIVIGENGYISVINGTDGEEFWHFYQNYELPMFETTSLPVVIPDYNNDGTSYLIVASSLLNSTETVKNNLVNVSMLILSGRNGKMDARIIIEQCSLPIDKLQLWKRNKKQIDILFYCLNNDGFGNLWSISAEKLRSIALKELSQNSTDFERILKMEQLEKKQSKVHYLEMEKKNSNGKDILVAWNEGNIALLNGETKTEKWIGTTDNHGDIKAILSGKFSKMENIAVLISSGETSGTTVTSFYLGNGSVVTNLTYDNYFITTALLLPEIFSETDGILLKRINMNIKPIENKPLSQYVLEKSQMNPLIKTFHYEEEYLVIQCVRGQNPQSISKTEVIRLCNQNESCLNDIYNNIPTVFVSNIDAHNSHGLISATTTLQVNKDAVSSVQEVTIVKLLHLSGSPFYNNNTKSAC